MFLLTPDQAAALKDRFLPDRPGPLVGLHVLRTGNGACFVDRWPDPRAVLVDTAGNYALSGEPAQLRPADLEGRIEGFLETSDAFVPLLEATFQGLQRWERVIFALRTASPFRPPRDQSVRRLESADAYHVWGLGPAASWIAKTWGGPSGLAASGHAWGAFVDGSLASIACTFFVGQRYEDVGVATEPEFRGRGLAAACAAKLCREILGRGRQPSWTTSPDNAASIRVAEKLGFALQRRDRLFVIGASIPEPPRAPSV
jgi:RimJ/RimL family protein N-acetyltransferase